MVELVAQWSGRRSGPGGAADQATWWTGRRDGPGHMVDRVTWWTRWRGRPGDVVDRVVWWSRQHGGAGITVDWAVWWVGREMAWDAQQGRVPSRELRCGDAQGPDGVRRALCCFRAAHTRGPGSAEMLERCCLVPPSAHPWDAGSAAPGFQSMSPGLTRVRHSVQAV